MRKYIYIALGIIAIIIIIKMYFLEINERKKFFDIPDCSYITNYCNEYGGKQNIKYVIKEPNKQETTDALLTKISTTYNRLNSIIYWRMAFFISLITCIFIWLYCFFENIKLKPTAYLLIFILVWFLNYWVKTNINFHYYNHSFQRIDELINQIRKNLDIKKS